MTVGSGCARGSRREIETVAVLQANVGQHESSCRWSICVTASRQPVGFEDLEALIASQSAIESSTWRSSSTRSSEPRFMMCPSLRGLCRYRRCRIFSAAFGRLSTSQVDDGQRKPRRRPSESGLAEKTGRAASSAELFPQAQSQMVNIFLLGDSHSRDASIGQAGDGWASRAARLEMTRRACSRGNEVPTVIRKSLPDSSCVRGTANDDSSVDRRRPQLVRKGLAAMLRGSEIEIVAEASNRDEAVERRRSNTAPTSSSWTFACPTRRRVGGVGGDTQPAFRMRASSCCPRTTILRTSLAAPP